MSYSMVMRNVCDACGCKTGHMETKNGQDVVRCFDCNKWQYNAPKTETGRSTRSTATVHAAIKPKQRTGVLLRANRTCELCGKLCGDQGATLHVGHLVSVDHGIKHGIPDCDLNSDENLCAMCDECNLGLGAESVPLRFAVCVAHGEIIEAKVSFRSLTF